MEQSKTHIEDNYDRWMKEVYRPASKELDILAIVGVVLFIAFAFLAGWNLK